MKKDNLEDLFKDSFENFEADVNPSVWKNIQTALKGASLGLLGKMLLNKMGSSAVISIVSSAAAVIATVFVMNGTKTETQKPTPKETVVPNVIAEKPTVDEIKTFLTPETNVAKETKETVVPEVKKVEEPKNTLTITNDKINSVIKEYSEQAVADISASPIGGQAGLVVNFTNNGTGKTNKWDFGDGRKETGTNPPHYYDEPGIYTVVLTSTSADGKTSSDSIKIEVTAKENSSVRSASGDFSPNGDGVRDYFGFNAENLINQTVVVFDKNKTIIYQSGSLSAKWDGTNLKGKPVKDGEYYYIQKAEGKDSKKYEQSGKITLKRH